MHTPGQPKLYNPRIANSPCLLPRRRHQRGLSRYFGVTRGTIQNWIANPPRLRDAVAQGPRCSRRQVVRALFERATGFSGKAPALHSTGAKGHTITTTVSYPPDTRPAWFWLRTCQSE